MSDYITLHYYLSQEANSKTITSFKAETIKSLKNILRKGLKCETKWSPQQTHYTITLYNQYYQELPDDKSLSELLQDGILWDNDEIQIILSVNSGQPVNYYDRITKYIRVICLGVYPQQIREDPNHNYMFFWHTETINKHSETGVTTSLMKNQDPILSPMNNSDDKFMDTKENYISDNEDGNLYAEYTGYSTEN